MRNREREEEKEDEEEEDCLPRLSQRGPQPIVTTTKSSPASSPNPQAPLACHLRLARSSPSRNNPRHPGPSSPPANRHHLPATAHQNLSTALPCHGAFG